ncbi:D-alanyl-D-alanine carboxypeptidase family protein [Roseomonas haemaphysalidis]|nr:D-alanyl-D-alanine carboxypeptidase family protein [Roseomonas haemaphysalidis]
MRVVLAMGMAARGLLRNGTGRAVSPRAAGSRQWRLALAGLAGAATLAGLLPGVAQAQIGSARYASVVMEPRTGNLLSSTNPDEPRHPASLTKMMTLYMLFDAMRAGHISPESRLVMTPTAAAKPPSKLGLRVGYSLSVEQGIYALVTKSANDIASLIGETLGGGDEDRFARMMTLRARAIGMTNTTFRNASGLPDIEQVTTARDMATLGRRLQQDFPERYHYFGTRNVVVSGSTLRNHNRMLDSYEGVDGIKTGYIDASGFNIVTSARRDNVRLIVSVFGGNSWTERDRHAAVLLDQGFAQMGVGGSGRTVMASAPSLVPAAAAAGAIAARRGRGTPSLVARAEAAPVAQRGGSARLVSTAAPVLNPAAGRAAARGTGGRVTARAEPAAPARGTASRRVRVVVEQGDGGPVRATLRRPARPAAQPARSNRR